MLLIEEFTRKFIENNEFKWIYELDRDGWNFPLLISIAILIALYIINLFTKHETKEDEYLVDGTTTSPGITLATIVIGVSFWSLSYYVILPFSKTIIPKYQKQLDEKLKILETSKNIDDNFKFIKNIYALENSFTNTNMTKKEKEITQSFFNSQSQYYNYYLVKYLKKRYLETNSLQFIEYGAFNIDNIRERKQFLKLLYLTVCPKLKGQTALRIDNYHCDVNYVFKHKQKYLSKLEFDKHFLFDFSKKFKKCEKFKWLDMIETKNITKYTKKFIDKVNENKKFLNSKYHCKTEKKSIDELYEKRIN